jgi:Animal haem peroxidase
LCRNVNRKVGIVNAVLAIAPDVPQDLKLALERRDYAAAEPLLEAEVGRRPGADAHALLALACFQNQHYTGAVRHYAAALAAAPSDDQRRSDWQDMLALAECNATSGVDVHVPPLVYFERAALLAPPQIADGALPAPLSPRPAHPWLLRLCHDIGNRLGVLATLLVNAVTHLWGRLAGWRDAVWTNWYHRPVSLAVLTLAYMRERLNARNLGTSYPPGTLVGFQPEGLKPPPGVTHFRTADGSWNNLADPKEGAAGTRFLRNVDLAAVRPETGENLLTPNPRLISRELLARPWMQEVPFLNLLAASWIQFMNGDWINHGEMLYDDVIEVPLPDDDPARARYWQTKMFVGKTQPDPTRTGGVEVALYSAVNEVTHWWDGSQIYGSDQATQDRLRSGIDGKLKLQADGTLPQAGNGVEDTGFTRNWWVGLAMLHTLFAREHNAICDLLKSAYPDWEDKRLFNVARLINAATMAKIHTIEWTPAILPNAALHTAMNANWYGLLVNAFRRGKQRRVVTEVKVANPELGGVVGNPIDKHGRGFGLTEEFVEVYRLHSLLPETLQLQRRADAAAPAATEAVPFHATRQSGSPRLTARWAMSDLFYSFGNQHPGALVLNNFPRFMQELSIPGNPFFDMGTVDIVRARERGVPRYNEFRRQLGLNPIRRFEDLTDDADAVRKLKAVYGENPADVERLDLLVGTLAEGHRPTDFGFGETMFQIFILNATRRLQSDRFYTDAFNADVYTPEGLRWIDEVDLKTVLLRHFPELASTGLANIRNAFEPWDTGAELDPARHPLRASDPELERDPWRGDAYRGFAVAAAANPDTE